MDNFLQIQKTLVPDLLQEMELRYDILKEIELSEVIGRRTLAQKIGLSERTVRSEIDFLKESKLIEILSSGMKLSPLGKSLLQNVEPYVSQIRGLHHLEKKIRELLGIRKVILTASFSDESLTLHEVGRLASKCMVDYLKDSTVLGVTGGNTMFQVAQAMQALAKPVDVIVVSARGSLGSHYETQATNVVGIIAEKLKSNYELLQLPDNIKKESVKELLKEATFEKTLHMIDEIDCLVFGIGNAEDMARRRNLSLEERILLKQNNAVAESFGFYFNIEGEIVYESSTLGINLSKYKTMKNIIGVAIGERKVRAIYAIAKINPNLTLVTDEDTAIRILEKAD